MKAGPFAGVMEPLKTFSTVLAEILSWFGTETRLQPDSRMYVRHINELRQRVDLTGGPDAVIPFTGTGAPVDINTTLTAAPRFWMLLDWTGGALTVWNAIPKGATQITVTAPAGVTGHVALHA